METALGVVVGIVVVLLLALLVAGFVLKRGAGRRQEQRLAAADELRGEAAGHTPDVQAATRRAEVADTAAENARERAERAEATAQQAHHDLAREQAAQEDVVRRADATDPRVDTDADDYRPITGPDMKGDPGRHQGPAEPDGLSPR